MSEATNQMTMGRWVLGRATPGWAIPEHINWQRHRGSRDIV